MKQTDEKVLKLLNDPNGKWILSTCDEEPHVAPTSSKLLPPTGAC